MHIRLVGPIAAFAMVLAFHSVALAQGAAQPGAANGQTTPAPHDLSGQWSGGVGGGLRIIGKVPPMTPEGQAKYDANTAEVKAAAGTISVDPTFRCEPPGVPHIYGIGAYMVELYQSADRPDRIFLFYESLHTWRTIWMNNRPTADNAGIPFWLGFSRGHWEGDDLVVESTGFDDRSWLNAAGYPHSDALKVTERFHRADHDHMKLDITIDDPKVYTQPWKMAVEFTLKPDWDFSENFCLPMNQDTFKSTMMPYNKNPAAK